MRRVASGSSTLSEPPGGGPPPAKKGRKAAAASSGPSFDQMRLCQEVFDYIRHLKREDGKLICEAFVRAPSRRSSPEYYKLVPNPIDLTRIQQKVKTEEYDSIDQLAADIQLLVDNGKLFYKKTSAEYKDACDLWDAFADRRTKLLDTGVSAVTLTTAAIGQSRDSSPSLRSASPATRSTRSKDNASPRLAVTGNDPVDRSVFEDLLAAVIQLTDEAGRLLSPPFRLLPCKEEFPEYYVTVKDPIDLKTIAVQIAAGHYRCLNDIDKDLVLLCRNAKLFNEPGTMIYKFIIRKKKELMETAVRPIEKERAEENTSVLAELLQQRVALADADGDLSEDSDEDIDVAVEGDPNWSLYLAVRRDDAAAPFLQLPDRNWYPDYFDEIKDPMSLFMINKKLKRKEYTKFEDLVEDISLIFQNAKSYNIEGSEIHEGAEILQALTAKTAKELCPSLDLSKFDLVPPAIAAQAGVSTMAAPVVAVSGQQGFATPQQLTTVAPTVGPAAVLVDPAGATATVMAAPMVQGTPTPGTPTLVASKKKKGAGSPGADGGPSRYSRGRPGRKSLEELQDRYISKLLLVWKSLHSTKDPASGRWLAEHFMELPSRKLYPDYYRVITEPIDLNTIRMKIDSGKYHTTGELRYDFELLFNNARMFNEEGSQIYADTASLEAAFNKAMQGLGGIELQSPRMLKEKFGWGGCRAPGGPLHKMKLVKETGVTAIGEKVTDSSSAMSAPQMSPMAVGSPLAVSVTPKAPLGRKPSSSAVLLGSPSGLSMMTPAQRRMWQLYNAVRDYTDLRGRKLSTIFMKLPSRNEYPDYYEAIKKPIDLHRIGTRLNSNQYDGLEALFQDLVLMFDNACRYNEPESIVYKDALSLQKVLLQKKAELKDLASMEQGSDGVEGVDDGAGLSTIPDVGVFVRDLLKQLFIAVNNHQDEEGRCYSDSLLEIPDRWANENLSGKPPASFDQIKRNLDKGRYRRLDRFQLDVFELLEKAREISRSDSQLFEDACELQMHFIRTRDELCKQGLQSPARFFTDDKAVKWFAQMRREKQQLEQKEDAGRVDDPRMSMDEAKDGDRELDEVEHNGITYRVGDFVYVGGDAEKQSPKQSRDNAPHLMRIERIWRDESLRQNFVSGLWFYRPSQTYHLATKRFLQQEVFKSVFYDNVTVDRFLGKCFVMFVRDYFKLKPKGFNDKDVYVCESKYLGRQLHFKKLKSWPYESDDVELLVRDQPLTPVRVPSVFATGQPITTDGDEDTKAGLLLDDSSVDDDDDCTLLDCHRMEAKLTINSADTAGVTPAVGDDSAVEDLWVYYEQLQYNDVWLRPGDAVLVRRPPSDESSEGTAEIQDRHLLHSDDNGGMVVRVDKLWRDQSGEAFLSGVWFAWPSEIEHEPTRMFLKRELFAVEQPDVVVSLSRLIAKCCVLPLREFCSMRPTEIAERLTFVSQYRVPGRNGGGDGVCSLTKSATTAASASANADDTTDEPIASPTPQQTLPPMSEGSARKLRILKSYNWSGRVTEDEVFCFKKLIVPEMEPSPLLMKTDTTVDADALSVADYSECGSEMDRSTEAPSTPKAISLAALATLPKLNSRSKSGYILFSAEIRRRVMERNPSETFGEISKIVGTEWKKLSGDEKKEYEARALAIAKEREKVDLLHPPSMAKMQPGQIQVFLCKWQGCDFQFENTDMLFEHITTVHTSQIAEAGEKQYVCLWTSCLKYRKEGKPFPSLPRLHRHLKEKHLPHASKCIFPNQRSKNFIPAYTPPLSLLPSTSQQQPLEQQQQFIPQQQQPQLQMQLGQQPQQMQQQQMMGGQQQPQQQMYFQQQQPQLLPPQQQVMMVDANGQIIQQPVGGQMMVAGQTFPQQQHQTPLIPQPQQQQMMQPSQQQQHMMQQAPAPMMVQQMQLQPTSTGGQQMLIQQQPIVQQQPQQHMLLGASGQQQPPSAVMTQLPPPPAQQQPTQQQVAGPSTMMQGDPGKTVVQRPAEPVFVPPPDNTRVQRVLHSEMYLRYIESLYEGGGRTGEGQTSVSKWDQWLGANARNTAPPPASATGARPPLPTNWLHDASQHSAHEVTHALWQLSRG